MKSIACVLVISICVLAAGHPVSKKAPVTRESKGCPLPYVLIGDRCLFFESVAKNTRNDMWTICHTMGGDLVKLDTIEVMSGIIEYIKENGLSDGDYWVGASDSGHEGSWVWTDGTPIPMGAPLWNQCSIPQPNGGTTDNCAVMDSMLSFLLADRSCSQTHYGICEKL